jgi:hypothetical protein
VDNLLKNATELKKVKTQSIEASHLIDARFNVPLFFGRFYLVFQFGRDRREARQNIFAERRRKAHVAMSMMMFSLVTLDIIAFLPGLFFLLYILKSALGINLFPNKHLWDFIGV